MVATVVDVLVLMVNDLLLFIDWLIFLFDKEDDAELGGVSKPVLLLDSDIPSVSDDDDDCKLITVAHEANKKDIKLPILLSCLDKVVGGVAVLGEVTADEDEEDGFFTHGFFPTDEGGDGGNMVGINLC